MATIEGSSAREGLKNALETQDGIKTHLVLGWRPEAANYKLELVDIEQEVSTKFFGYAQTVAAQLAERAAITYDPEWPLREHEHFELASDELPGGTLFNDLSDFQNLPRFVKKRLTKPQMYVAALQTPQGSAFFGKRMAYLKVLSQNAGTFAAVWDGSTFNALNSSVATFSTTFDWVFWNDTLYVLDAAGFHSEFRDSAALQKAVTGHIDGIDRHVKIVNSGSMKERCRRSVPMASKLKRVAERGLHLTSTIDQLKAYATKYEIPVAWDNDDLVFDGSLEGQWAILKLLDEDRTEGPISHRHYESAAKREV